MYYCLLLGTYLDALQTFISTYFVRVMIPGNENHVQVQQAHIFAKFSRRDHNAGYFLRWLAAKTVR
jgi:ABC-type enterochelin transport system permease subunit